MNTRLWLVACAMGVSVTACSAARAERPGAQGTPGASRRADADQRMLKPMAGEFRGQRLEDVLKYIAEVTGAEFEPMWLDDDHTTGMDKERAISMRFAGISALRVLERVLEQASDGDAVGACAWQTSASNTVQVGPRGRLNAYRRVEIYDVHDLLHEAPDFLNAPRLDLQAALQSGTGSQSVFRDNGTPAPNSGPGGVEAKSVDRRADQIRALLVEFVEPDQWQERGGDGATIRVYQGALIVNASEYVHRQINGRRGR